MYTTKIDYSLPSHPERESLEGKNKFIGFWFFLGGETVLFGTLFATYLTLKASSLKGPTSQELFELPFVALMTFILLTSSLTSVFAVLSMKNKNYRAMQVWFAVTVLLGLAFLGGEIYEFTRYVAEGHTFTSSAFGSAFYTLVGFHGGHVLFGVLWISILHMQIAKKGITATTAPKFYVASLYWHFVDLVWVFIFTVVYLLGKVG